MAERGAVGTMGSWGRLSRYGAWLGTVLLLAGVLAGHSQAQTPVQTPVQAPGKASVRLVDHAGLEAEIARHTGKVVVVDFWSTSCPPCVKEFPRLVALKKSHGERIACISFSLDYEGIDAPEELLPTIEKFLDKVGAGDVVNLLSTEEADAVYRKLDLVSVPAVYVYGPDGKLVQRFDEDDATKRLKRPFTYDDVEEVVGRLLGK
jgi:thiol-disulfide isomerase/thioredoxin